MGVGPGFFYILPPKIPTETNFASAKASPEASKTRVQKVALMTPAAPQKANVFWILFILQNNILNTLREREIYD